MRTGMSHLNPADTSLAAERAQRRVFARMGGAGRLNAAFEMSDEMRATLESGIRARHPEFGHEAVARAVLAILYGARLAEAVFPGSPEA